MARGPSVSPRKEEEGRTSNHLAMPSVPHHITSHFCVPRLQPPPFLLPHHIPRLQPTLYPYMPMVLPTAPPLCGTATDTCLCAHVPILLPTTQACRHNATFMPCRTPLPAYIPSHCQHTCHLCHCMLWPLPWTPYLATRIYILPPHTCATSSRRAHAFLTWRYAVRAARTRAPALHGISPVYSYVARLRDTQTCCLRLARWLPSPLLLHTTRAPCRAVLSSSILCRAGAHAHAREISMGRGRRRRQAGSHPSPPVGSFCFVLRCSTPYYGPVAACYHTCHDTLLTNLYSPLPSQFTAPQFIYLH